MRLVKTRLLVAATAFALGVVLAPAPARACTISSAGVAFGAYDPQSAGAEDSAGTVRADCHPSVSAPIVALSTGQSGTFAARTMTSGPYTLSYNIYSDSGRTIIWGDGTGGAVTVTMTGGSVSGGVRRFTGTMYGRIPAGQNVGAGSYLDTIILTITF